MLRFVCTLDENQRATMTCMLFGHEMFCYGLLRPELAKLPPPVVPTSEVVVVAKPSVPERTTLRRRRALKVLKERLEEEEGWELV